MSGKRNFSSSESLAEGMATGVSSCDDSCFVVGSSEIYSGPYAKRRFKEATAGGKVTNVDNLNTAGTASSGPVDNANLILGSGSSIPGIGCLQDSSGGVGGSGRKRRVSGTAMGSIFGSNGDAGLLSGGNHYYGQSAPVDTTAISWESMVESGIGLEEDEANWESSGESNRMRGISEDNREVDKSVVYGSGVGELEEDDGKAKSRFLEAVRQRMGIEVG